MPTIRELREQRGISRDDLALELGYREEEIARIEDVGLPTPAGAEWRAWFINDVLGDLQSALDVPRSTAISFTDAPREPEVGSFVLDPAALANASPEVEEFLREHADEIGLKMCVPNEYDVHLKDFTKIEDEDLVAILRFQERDEKYCGEMARKCREMAEFARAQASTEEESITLFEAKKRHEEGTERMRNLFDDRGEA